MNLSLSFRASAVALALAAFPAIGSAQIVDTKTVNFLGEGAFNQTSFTVTAAGTFHIYTTSDHDTQLWLYAVGNPEALAYNDDGGSPTHDFGNNSSLLVDLGVGSYFASSDHFFQGPFSDPYVGFGPFINCYHVDPELGGFGDGVLPGGCTENFKFELTNHIDALDGGSLDEVATTPEPASLVLLGTGLLGVAGIVRRRKK